MKISKLNKVILTSTGAVASVFGLSTPVSAQGAGVDFNFTGYNSLLDFINFLLQFAFYALILVSVAMLVYAGFLYVTASGDDQKIEKATKTIIYAIVGLILAFISSLIVTFVLENLLGASLPTN